MASYIQLALVSRLALMLQCPVAVTKALSGSSVRLRQDQDTRSYGRAGPLKKNHQPTTHLQGDSDSFKEYFVLQSHRRKGQYAQCIEHAYASFDVPVCVLQLDPSALLLRPWLF